MGKYIYTVKSEDAGYTVKEILRRNFSFSARMMTRFKRNDCILLNGATVRINAAPNPGDIIDIGLPEEESNFTPENIPVIPLFEDEDLLIINKPAGFVVHPTKGNPAHTIANGVARYAAETGQNFKIRFINRLDMDTSGLLIIAKNAPCQNEIMRQMEENKVTKKYIALVHGLLIEDSGTIDAPLGWPDIEQVYRRVVPGGRPSVTHFSVLKRYEKGFSLVELRLETGRTHQIRVHMSHIGHPVVGDRLYGGEDVRLIGRQALHAHFISLFHPVTNRLIEVSADMPEDMLGLLGRLK